VRPADDVLLVHTLYHPAQRRAIVNPEGADVEVSQQDVRPILRTINAADGEIRWADYQDDFERRLTQLVEAKVAAAQGPRAGRRNGRHQAGNGRPNGQPDPVAREGRSRPYRRAA
jgi:non-homologous end joining protein Ku